MLIVHASELAAAVGLHRYRPVADVVTQLFARMDGSTYARAMERNELREKQDIQRTLEQLSATTTVEHLVSGTATELQEKLDKTIGDITDDPTLAAEIQSFVFTERGKQAEDSSLDRVEQSIHQKIQQRNARYYKKFIEYEPGRTLQIGGRVDGITEDGKLVEIKNRQRRLFPTVPLYEKIQVHAYMYLTDIHECQLVQSFRNKEVTTVVPFDTTFWGDIIRRVSLLGKHMDELMVSSTRQDLLLVHQQFPIDFEAQVEAKVPDTS